jgi:prevent-host-death family protein
MTSIGTFEAKTHLTQLLGRVAKGEKILITNRGRPVAMLVPPEPENGGDVAGIVKEMLRVRDEQGPSRGKNLTVREMREEGRRF